MGTGGQEAWGADLPAAFISNIVLLNKMLVLFLGFFCLFVCLNKPETWGREVYNVLEGVRVKLSNCLA